MVATRGCTCSRGARAWQPDGTCSTCGQRVLETQLAPVVLQVLCAPGTGCVLWRNAAGYDERRKVRYGLTPGAADYVGLYRGRYLEVELKTPRGRQSPEQIEHQALVERAGGVYEIVRSEADARALLERLRG